MEKLEVLKEALIEGQKLSMQGSYDRRAPAKKAVPFLLKGVPSGKCGFTTLRRFKN
jgi:hypothetical protein